MDNDGQRSVLPAFLLNTTAAKNTHLSSIDETIVTWGVLVEVRGGGGEKNREREKNHYHLRFSNSGDTADNLDSRLLIHLRPWTCE